MLFINFSYFRALTGKYPPKIRMYSKYERRTDTRTYEDRKKLYEGVSISHFITLFVIWKFTIQIRKKIINISAIIFFGSKILGLGSCKNFFKVCGKKNIKNGLNVQRVSPKSKEVFFWMHRIWNTSMQFQKKNGTNILLIVFQTIVL